MQVYCYIVLFFYCPAVVNGSVECGATYACGCGYLGYGVQL